MQASRDYKRSIYHAETEESSGAKVAALVALVLTSGVGLYFGVVLATDGSFFWDEEGAGDGIPSQSPISVPTIIPSRAPSPSPTHPGTRRPTAVPTALPTMAVHAPHIIPPHRHDIIPPRRLA